MLVDPAISPCRGSRSGPRGECYGDLFCNQSSQAAEVAGSTRIRAVRSAHQEGVHTGYGINSCLSLWVFGFWAKVRSLVSMRCVLTCAMLISSVCLEVVPVAKAKPAAAAAVEQAPAAASKAAVANRPLTTLQRGDIKLGLVCDVQDAEYRWQKAGENCFDP